MQNEPLLVKVKRMDPAAIIPQYAHETDAGFDLCALEDCVIGAERRERINTGLAFEIPPGYVGLIWDKSSRGNEGLKSLAGVIDSGYRGHVVVILHNLAIFQRHIKAGERIAQMLIQPVPRCIIQVVDKLSDTSRGEAGFGSSGTTYQKESPAY